MKKIMLIMFACFSLLACDRTEKITPDDQVPDAVLQAVKTAFPTASDLTVIVLKEKALYEVEFVSEKTDYEAVVTVKGEMQELRQNAKTFDVSQNIQAYLDAQYPNATINFVVEDLDPQDKSTIIGYWVYITTTDAKYYQLYFDALGGFVSEMEVTNPSNTDSKYQVLEGDLPTAILTYLSTNHNGYTFSDAWAIVMNNVTTYYVSVNYNGILYYYEFAEDATVISTSSYDPNNGTNPGGGANTTFTNFDNASQIPATISDYLDQNFSGWQFQKGFSESDNAGVLRYVIVALVGNSTYYIEFDGNMQFAGATVY